MHHQPTRPATWRAVPTALLVAAMLVLGAITAGSGSSPDRPAAHHSQGQR